MKFVVAPDSYKGNLRSARVGEIVREAILREMPEATVETFPMGDGGEGTVEALTLATGGETRHCDVCGPLGGCVRAAYGILPDGTVAAEMASASGIELLPEDALDPMAATTYGTGELLRRILEEGARRIVLGIGGSATVDGGVGMLQALGFRFLDDAGERILERGGAALRRIASVDDSGAMPELKSARLLVACDVVNPLTGPAGAARVFGPQKGATPEMVERLDAGLRRLREAAGAEERPGDGAAGGLGYALRVFCGAEMRSGARLVAETAGVDRALIDADWLIVGEGRTDEQTASGKLCAVLAEMARERGVRTLLLSGALRGTMESFFDTFDLAHSISSGEGSLPEAMAKAPENLAFAVRNVVRALRYGEKD